MTAIAQKRIMRDVMNVTHTDVKLLESQGIFYFPNESNISEGTALLIGQEGTPYFGGFYYFSITFPHDYPFSPIAIQSLTQDGKTRFNPNMYLNGKVCLSILNTWHDGPQWTGIQTLESVLLIIMSDVLNRNPLENEPAFRGCGDSTDAVIYRRQIWHANVSMIHTMLSRTPVFATSHAALMLAEFAKRREAILAVNDSVLELHGITETCRVFSMTVKYDFLNISEKLRTL